MSTKSNRAEVLENSSQPPSSAPREHAAASSVPADERVPVLSFFTGAGFLDLGFERAEPLDPGHKPAGFDVIWRNEISPQFIRGFEYAMKQLGHDCAITNRTSITELGPNTIAKEAFPHGRKPGTFGMIGGPPCPDFSVGGKNRGRAGDHGKLSQVYVNRIWELRPTFFLFENVPGLLRTHKHRVFLQHLVDQLAPDYLIDIQVLCALEYGVPQDRERVFLVGFKRSWLKAKYGAKGSAFLPLNMHPQILDRDLSSFRHWFPWDTRRTHPGAKAKYEWPDTSPFGGSPERPAGIPEELMVGPRICDYSETSKLPNGTEHFIAYSTRFGSVAEGDVSRKSFKRLHRWRYSPAAAYGNNEVHMHPSLPRRLTVREAMRIQTVPDKYALPPEMPLSYKFKTIGNGVPVGLATAVASGFLQVLGGRLCNRST